MSNDKPLIDPERLKVEITDGQNIINILNDDFCNALVIEKAMACNWPDCRGSIGEYYAISSFKNVTQQELSDKLNQTLIYGTDAEILEKVTEFLSLFSNGTYNIVISVIDKADIFHDEQVEYAAWIPEEERFNGSFYNFDGNDIYIFSRSYKSINKDRVNYYIDLLKKGMRPKVVAYYHEYESTPRYILDGHHKILAYQELKMEIPFVLISKDSYHPTPTVNIISDVIHVLKPNELKHMLVHNPATLKADAYTDKVLTEILDDYLKNSKSISIDVSMLLYNAFDSGDDKQRHWANERLEKLKHNRYKGTEQYLYFKRYSDDPQYTIWGEIFIKNDSAFNLWKDIFLNDRAISEEMEKEIKEFQKPL